MTVATKKKLSNSNRGRLDIIADILEASHRKVRKTHLMYHCNLSFKQLDYYLNFLVERKLLSPINNSKSDLFKITEKGERFLDVYKGLLGLMG
ncbi:MAG: winged helix-turn-helix domain-containing protein [Candidatus Bathycorpusculaceae bacterium]